MPRCKLSHTVMADDGSHGTVDILFSCTPGFEKICESEIQEKVTHKVYKEERGRVIASLCRSKLSNLHQLRSVHHYYVVTVCREFPWIEGECKEEILTELESLATKVTWNNALKTWEQFRTIENSTKTSLDVTSPSKVEEETNVTTTHLPPQLPKSPTYNDCPDQQGCLKFRVTTNRIGKHSFTSPDASRYLGSGVKERFGWEVDLENYDVNVQSFITGPKLILSLQLTTQSQHKRNLSLFGPTSLIPTISYCILRLAEPQIGDIICDPMCGGGSICLEGAHSFLKSFHLGGEIHPEGCSRSQANFVNYCSGYNMKTERDSCLHDVPYGIVQWDACSIPLRTGSVDIVVCDLPFGRKMGHRTKNWSLYTCCLRESARICKIKEGRAVLITQHKEAFNRALKLCHHLWRKRHIYHISMGGLNVGVYVLSRTTNLPKPSKK